jgi:hypothetical protein
MGRGGEGYRVESDLVVDSSSMERKEMTRSEELLMTGGERISGKFV